MVRLGPIRSNDQSLVSQSEPHLFSHVWCQWGQHSCFRIKYLSENLVSRVSPCFLRAQPALIPGGIVLQVVKNDVHDLSHSQSFHRHGCGLNCCVETTEHPPVECRIDCLCPRLPSKLPGLRYQTDEPILNSSCECFAEVSILIELCCC